MLRKAPATPGDPSHVARYPHPDERTPGDARTWLTRTLDGLDQDALDAACLVLSELVTNAVTHGTGPVSVTADLAGGHLTLTVEGQARPVDLDAADGGLAEHGRGLGIVAALALRVGFSVTAVLDAGGAL